MNKLPLSQFVNPECFILEGPNTIVAEITRVFHKGYEWLALRREKEGWIWLKISGRNPKRNKPVLFTWGDAIYNERKFYKKEPVDLSFLDVQEPIKSKDTIIHVPEKLKDAKTAYDAVQKNGYKPYPEVEHYLAQNAKYAYLYAYHALKGNRFWKGEEVIEKSPEYAYFYAINIIRDRWEAGEKAISQYPDLVSRYCKQFGLRFNTATKTFI